MRFRAEPFPFDANPSGPRPRAARMHVSSLVVVRIPFLFLRNFFFFPHLAAGCSILLFLDFDIRHPCITYADLWAGFGVNKLLWDQTTPPPPLTSSFGHCCRVFPMTGWQRLLTRMQLESALLRTRLPSYPNTRTTPSSLGVSIIPFRVRSRRHLAFL